MGNSRFLNFFKGTKGAVIIGVFILIGFIFNTFLLLNNISGAQDHFVFKFMYIAQAMMLCYFAYFILIFVPKMREEME